MRPALEGHAGIPQENRLLFRALCGSGEYDVQGLLQSGGNVLSVGLPVFNGEIQHSLARDEALHRLCRVVVSLLPAAPGERLDSWRRTLKSKLSPIWLMLQTLVGRRQSLSGFEPAHFQDFVWRSLFAKSLPHTDLQLVTRSTLRVLQPPYGAMHACGLATRLIGRAAFPILETTGVDVVIAQTPYPGRVVAPTRLVIRYMDAVPMMLPHTIVKRSFHQASHYEALRRNVLDGAYFACASEATRRDLVGMFPKAEERAVTIHCMLSHHYYYEESSPARVPEILAKWRFAPTGVNLPAPLPFDPRPPEYLLMVSTLEPRKNHTALIAAWEQVRSSAQPGMKLVLVGSLGWESESTVSAISPWIERGEIHLLNSVPADDLRVLYRHASLTVCPSLAEGFDYSGVESMRCGGLIAASDIPVHREVFADAAEYFNPYAPVEMAACINQLLDPGSKDSRAQLREKGSLVSAQYLPEQLVPKWRSLLERVSAGV
jgi:glycosyltransferase involved in cell wall biosynthesis